MPDLKIGTPYVSFGNTSERTVSVVYLPIVTKNGERVNIAAGSIPSILLMNSDLTFSLEYGRRHKKDVLAVLERKIVRAAKILVRQARITVRKADDCTIQGFCTAVIEQTGKRIHGLKSDPVKLNEVWFRK